MVNIQPKLYHEKRVLNGNVVQVLLYFHKQEIINHYARTEEERTFY